MRVRAMAVGAAAIVALTGCAAIQRVSIAPNGETNGASVEPALSHDGSLMAFASTASNLVPNDTNGVADVFVRDAVGTVTRVSVASNGTQGDGPSTHPTVSGNGEVIAFQSDATNLVPGDTNASTDIFARDRTAGTTTLVSVPTPGPPTAAALISSVATTPPSGSATRANAAAGSLRNRDALLLARAAQSPQRVIVHTATGFRAEGGLSASARAGQRGAIKHDQDAVATLIGTGGHITARARTLPIVVATVDAAALGRLRASPRVLNVTADDPVPTALLWSGPAVGLPAAQDAGYTGRGQAVAILDTGVSASHPFLGGRVVDQSCFSALGSCPNGLTSQTGFGAAAPCTYAPNGCRHGTHVAGIAAGGALDATGVAPRASIIAVQIFSRLTGSICSRGEDPCPLTFPSDWILGLEHVYELRDTYKIAAVNMSIGGLTSPVACDADPVKPAIDQLRSVGIATVIAAGNEGLSTAVGYPGCISSAVTVGAASTSDAIAGFSNSSPLVDLFAPGVVIQSSVPGGGFAIFNGTSMATPHVAGAYALAKEQHPEASVDGILTRMQQTGRTIHDARNNLDFSRLCASGVLDLDRCPNPRGSRRPSISANGRRIAFESDEVFDVSDENLGTDIYVRDLDVTTTQLVSTGIANFRNLPSTHASISGDGTRVAFDSLSIDLVAGDTNAMSDVFVRDLAAGATTRVSTATGGGQGSGTSRDAAISGDGSSVAFASDSVLTATDTNSVTDIYVRNLATGTTTILSLATPDGAANGPSRSPALSRDGRFVTFASDATNLGPDTNAQTDIYVRDRLSSLTQRVSTSFFLGQGDAWSTGAAVAPTGGVVAVTSVATNLGNEADQNGAFDVYRRAIISPTISGFAAAPIARGSSAPFTMTGRGLLPPTILTSSEGITFSISVLTPTQISGTVSAASTAATGPHNVTVVNLNGVPGFFAGTLCPSCLTIT